jgi:tRNA modification GTPase
MTRDKDQDTICALSTPAGVGGISVIRVSGPHATSMTRALCEFLPEKPESHRVYYGFLRSLDVDITGEPVDEVLVTYFQKGRSFTGEDTIEISCHGNPQIVREILSELVNAGARPADRGEFTYRAFMQGRLDLVQAESILALIESQSKRSAQQALRQLQGSLSQELEQIESDLIWCLAHIEASIDFSTEGLDVVDNTVLLGKVHGLQSQIKKLVDSFQKGRILKDGFQLVLTGIPNVGKSSLLNLLVEEDRAIVTEIPGTTRDLIVASFMIQGMKVNVVDTAGLRDSSDRVEKIGIERSYGAQKEADGIFFVFDSSKPLSEQELQELKGIEISKLHLIGNKRDQGDQTSRDRRDKVLNQLKDANFFQNLHGFDSVLKEKIHIVSAFDKSDGEKLKEILLESLGREQYEDQAVISQARHFENLSGAFENMMQAEALVKEGVSPELSALELKEALLRIQETLGKRFDDQIMDRVFKEFCIGK